MRGEIATTVVSEARVKLGERALSGAEVDSLRVTRVRVLISELKFHRNNSDTSSGDNLLKAGPMIATFDSAGTKVFAAGSIPSGTYDKVKFEFHRFSSSEVGGYLTNPDYADFVTDDRWTVLVDGDVYVGGATFPFTYRSDMTANLTLSFVPPIATEPGTTVIVAVVVDPVAIFKAGGKVLDPRDASNESEIDNAIKSAIKALKR